MSETLFQPIALPLHLLHLHIDHSKPPEPSPEALDRWNELTRTTPRLFNGPILSFTRFEDDTIHARVDSYQRLVTREPGVCHLSVTAVLRHRGKTLLGKRSAHTAVHPDVWELAPSGGLDVPKADRTDARVFWTQLLEEMNEEIGPGWSLTPGEILGLVIDPSVPSADLVITADVTSEGPAVNDRWEHDELRWVPLRELAEFARTNPCIPTVAPLAQAMDRWA